jgi:hypothetical protein
MNRDAIHMETARDSVKLCSRCVEAQLRRLNRIGFWERKVLTYFGYYPWECVICRKKQYFADSGQRQSAG